MILDDLNVLKQVDTSDALGVAGTQAGQLQHDFQIGFTPKAPIKNIVLGGMGGSAWPSLILSSWPRLSVPFEISRDYTIPQYVNESTLFIASSYSGNTEETLAALEAAITQQAQIIVFAAGGKLAETAKERGLTLFEIPSGFQPRMSSFYFLTALVQLLEPLGFMPNGAQAELHAAADWLASQNATWLAEVTTDSNPAKQLAEKLVGKSVIVYSGPLLFPAANKWKICINENAKNLAWSNQYPELNHNEFIGWSSHPVEKPFAVVEIQSQLEHPRTQQRFALTDKLLSGKRPHALVVEPKGETVLQQILWAFNFGDYVSLYLAVLNNVDPTPVGLVERFKKDLQ